MRYEGFPEYVPVRVRRARAEQKLRQLQKRHPHLKPVILDGQTLARTWWGKSWNRNLERYADYSNRIGRGRSYVRNRAVLDLQLAPGKVTAMVQGSRPQPYDVVINITRLNARNWGTVRKACAGAFDSLSELLAGTFPRALQEIFFDKDTGLFPTPGDIRFDCSCPDWASMCKHVAAALYGIGVRLDNDPALFFTLRGINIDDLITQTVTDTAQRLLSKAREKSRNVLQDVDLGDVFGIQLDDIDAAMPALPAVPRRKSTARKRQTGTRRRLAVGQTARVSTPGITARRSMPPQPAAAIRKAGSVSGTARRAVPPGAAAAARTPQHGTMLETLLKAVGTARKGKSVDQLQEKLGWTRMQIRNAISRASAKGLLETTHPGVYRRPA